MIEITGTNLIELAKKAYELSSPQGLGFLHYQSGSLTDEEAKLLVREEDSFSPLGMDYVRGRAVKLDVIKKGRKLFLSDSWYDHTDDQYKELLSSIGAKSNNLDKHSVACNCAECKD